MNKNHVNKKEPTFWSLFFLFIKISLFLFGGENALFPMIKNYCVDKYGWLTEKDIDDILIVTNSIPGPSAIEAIAYISYFLLKSKWKAFLVTSISLLPHTLLFFAIFILGVKFIPSQYLKIIYIAVVPIIIALLIGMSIRYLKIEYNGIPVTIHWIVFVTTFSFCFFAPTPWSMPIFIIGFLLLC